jgi:hypothetical protein
MRRQLTHPLNVSYLVVGVVFLGIAGIWALRTAGVVGTDELHWLFPLTLVAAGAVGLAAFVARGLRDDRRTPADDPADDPTGDFADDFAEEPDGTDAAGTRGDLR